MGRNESQSRFTKMKLPASTAVTDVAQILSSTTIFTSTTCHNALIYTSSLIEGIVSTSTVVVAVITAVIVASTASIARTSIIVVVAVTSIVIRTITSTSVIAVVTHNSLPLSDRLYLSLNILYVRKEKGYR